MSQGPLNYYYFVLAKVRLSKDNDNGLLIFKRHEKPLYISNHANSLMVYRTYIAVIPMHILPNINILYPNCDALSFCYNKRV